MDLNFIYILIGLFIVSVILAVRSMRDYDLPKELRRMIDSRRVKGSIVFFKKDIKHYRQTKRTKPSP